MKLTFAAKSMTLTDSIQAYAEKKAAKLNKYFNENAEAAFRFTEEKSNRYKAELTINERSLILRAEEASDDLYACIDRVMDKIVRQLRKHRTKLEKKLKEGAFEIPEELPVTEEEEEHKVVRTKTFAVKPMDVEDAVAELELLGHSFYLFKNAETETVCAVYRRADDDYGLLIPEDA